MMEGLLSLPSLSVVSRTPGRYTALKPPCGEPERLTQSQMLGPGGALKQELCGRSCSPRYTGEVALQSPQAIWGISGSTQAGWLGQSGLDWAGLVKASFAAGGEGPPRPRHPST